MKKNQRNIRILAIETSCDETAAAVICGTNENSKSEYPPRQAEGETGRNPKQIQNSKNQIPKILSSVVSSQADLHAKTGGVVPEVASRAHMEAIIPVIEETLACASSKSQILNPKQFKNSNNQNSKVSDLENSDLDIVSNLEISASDLLSEITHIAVTAGPGLIGSLLVGFNAAKTIAAARNLPLIPINHIEGHIYSAFGAVSQKSKVKSQKFPILALTVSGGHTSLTLMKDHGKYETIGETIDDAAGEAFDKVAKLLGLGYPGGPVVSKFASEFRNKLKVKSEKLKVQGITFPRPMLNKPNFDFSFSGLKTAVLTEVNRRKAYSLQLTAYDLHEICYAFEEAVVDVLVTKTLRAFEKYHPKSVILAGGVAANKRLREELSGKLSSHPRLDRGSINNKLLVDSRLRGNDNGSNQLLMPEISLCGDNAAMIGIAAYYHILTSEEGLSAEDRAKAENWRKAKIDSNLEL